MLLDENSNDKPKIDYPCEWGYKIIGTNRAELEAVICKVMKSRTYKQKGGNSSSKGKFHSLSTSCEVESEVDRDAIFKAFQEHKDVKMVI